ncbi:hypothetical protein ACOSP7_008714 [Xanthoceras sorbifolium]
MTNKKLKIESLWCDLPSNVIISIVECLYYVDQIRFRAVCKGWRSEIYGKVKYADNFPWILALRGISNRFTYASEMCYLYDPIHKQKYTIRNPILVASHIHASKCGWLLLSRDTISTYRFSFYSPFTNKIIELPELDKRVSGKFFQRGKATFSAPPTSSDCVICCVSTEVGINDKYFKEFRVSTCSPYEDRTWNDILLGLDGYKYNSLISQIAYINGVFYFTFENKNSVMGAFTPGLPEWKAYPYAHKFSVYNDSLIESNDDGENMLMASYDGTIEQWYVYELDKTKLNWYEIEKLGNRMLFVSCTSSSLQRKGTGALANTIHIADNNYRLECSSLSYNTQYQSCPQIYGWIEANTQRMKIFTQRMKIIWIEPPQII